MKRIFLWFRIIRPQTLFASLVPVLVGILVVKRTDAQIAVENPALVAGLTAFCAVCLQIFSNLVNDLYDYLRGSDKAGRAGFKRALAENEVSKSQMLLAIAIVLLLVLSSGLYLVISGGLPILVIGVTAIFFAWLYTATSHSLSYLGIADVFVLLYYGVVASAGTAYLLIHSYSRTAFFAGAVCGLISMGVLMINNLRDIEDDKVAGKKTLAVRFGKGSAEMILLVEEIMMPVMAWLAFGLSLPMLIVIPALLLYRAVLKAEGAGYNKCLLATGLLNVLYFLLCLFGI